MRFHAILVKICINRGKPLFHSNDKDDIIVKNIVSFIDLNRWKLEGAKSKLCGRCESQISLPSTHFTISQWCHHFYQYTKADILLCPLFLIIIHRWTDQGTLHFLDWHICKSIWLATDIAVTNAETHYLLPVFTFAEGQQTNVNECNYSVPRNFMMYLCFIHTFKHKTTFFQIVTICKESKGYWQGGSTSYCYTTNIMSQQNKQKVLLSEQCVCIY